MKRSRFTKEQIAFALKQVELRRTSIGDNAISETVNQAISAMSYREALIYRDWQDAIGDAMLEPDAESVRRFKIVGYDRFEAIIKGEALWIRTFRESINDIDFEEIDPNDFRGSQLKKLAAAVSNILIPLSQTKEQDLIGASELAIART